MAFMFQLRIDTVTVVKEISQISVVNKYSKAPDSGEAREVHLPFHMWSLTKNNVEIDTDFGIVRGPNINYFFVILFQ